eukprot:CAMPEP_0182441810 /NCGR_PEP_ID=MMETSP1172-20130603/812_1 /TAXON_ID=708627 /ORGANISM="Timspurckia oligopyrenoides, Strain CCMP3278" /LENGTH=885 /DNA_ID=CAMNT_0024636361 /DNA_START=99 /DNA_END=2756 /DNA_ORIENTATION=+
MSCIRVDLVVQQLCDVLHIALSDSDAYVRKTAAICVAKLAYMDQEKVVEHGFLIALEHLLTDPNATVVANALQALADIDSLIPGTLQLDNRRVGTLLAALEYCTEWAQIAILDTLSEQIVVDSAHAADAIIESVVPRLQHANHAVAMSSVRLIFKCMRPLTRTKTIEKLLRKIARPMLSMVADSSAPASQYLAIRNMRLVYSTYGDLFLQDIDPKLFFCQYQDPLYLKREKLIMLVLLSSQKNSASLVDELCEYALDVDPAFVRHALLAMSQLAIRQKSVMHLVLNSLNEMCSVKGQRPQVLQACVIALVYLIRSEITGNKNSLSKDLQSIIIQIADHCASVAEDDVDCKCALAWILGEYGSDENAIDMFESLCDLFVDDSREVQLQLLASVCKLCLRFNQKSNQLALLEDSRVNSSSNELYVKCKIMFLSLKTRAESEIDNFDVSEKAILYDRLLSDVESFEAASSETIVDSLMNSRFGVIRNVVSDLDSHLVESLRSEFSSLASVLYCAPEDLVHLSKQETNSDDIEGIGGEDSERVDIILTGETQLIDFGDGNQLEVPTVIGGTAEPLLDLEAIVNSEGQLSQSEVYHESALDIDDLLSSLTLEKSNPAVVAQNGDANLRSNEDHTRDQMKNLIDETHGRGLCVFGRLEKDPKNGAISYRLRFDNRSDSQSLSGFGIKLNSNVFGLYCIGELKCDRPKLEPKSSCFGKIHLGIGESKATDDSKQMELQIALRCQPIGVLYCSDSLSDSIYLFIDPVIVSREEFDGYWEKSEESSTVRMFQNELIEENAVVLSDRQIASLRILGFHVLKATETRKQALSFCAKVHTTLVLVEIERVGSETRVLLRTSGTVGSKQFIESIMECLMNRIQNAHVSLSAAVAPTNL